MSSYRLNALSSAPQPEAAVLCRFPRGPPEELRSPSTFSSITFALHSHRDSRDARKATHRILTADSEAVSYAATNYLPEQSYRQSPHCFALGVVQEAERRIDLVPVTHVYSMQQWVKRRTVSVPEDEGGVHVEVKDDDQADAALYSLRQRQLVDAFGSKKKKTQLASRESNRVVVQDEIANKLHVALSGGTQQEQEDGQEGGAALRMDEAQLMKATKAALLPPFDDVTDDPQRVYQLDKLIPKSVYSLLHAEAKRLSAIARDETLLSSLAAAASAASADSAGSAQAASVAEHDVTRFMLRRLQLLSGMTDQQHVMRSCSLLAFYRLLLQLKLGQPRNPRGSLLSLPRPPAPAVVSYLLSVFASSSQTLDSVGGRRVLCWLLVTTLLLGRGRLDGDDVAAVADDVRLTPGEVAATYREVGCSGASKTEVQLVAPLTLSRFKRRKRKAAR
jgi:hypothetical protein